MRHALKDGEDLDKEDIFHKLFIVGKCESLVKADRDLRPGPRMRGRRKGCCPSCLSVKNKRAKDSLTLLISRHNLSCNWSTTNYF